MASSSSSCSAASPPKEATSKYWGVSWSKAAQRWEAGYCDANGKGRYLGLFDDQESAALAVNAAIRTLPAAVQRRRRANPVVDGQLVPKKRAPRKRRREEEATCAICFGHDGDARLRPRDVRGVHGATGRFPGPDPDAVAAPRRHPVPAAVPGVDRAGPRVRN